jgi:hypothetical protein
MGSTIAKVIAAGLAASVSPVSVMVLITLMFTKKPIRNSSLFLLGFTLTLIAIGLVAVFVLHAGGHEGKTTFDAWIDIGLGVLCLAAIPLSVRKRSKQKEPEEAGGKSLTALRAFTFGVITMAIDASTIVIYISGVHFISAAKLSAGGEVALFAILTFFSVITLLVPMALYIVFPDRAKKLLNALKAWLVKHSKLIGAGILLVFGVALLVKGIQALV